MKGNIVDLYQKAIREHSRNPEHRRELAGVTHRARLDNPGCGDWIELSLVIEDEIITDAAFQGEGCALCIASADILCGLVHNRSLHDAEELQVCFTAALSGEQHSSDSLPDAVVPLLVVRDFPGRNGCVLPGWECLGKMF